MLRFSFPLPQSTLINHMVSNTTMVELMMAGDIHIQDILAIDLEKIKKNLRTKHGDKLWTKEKCEAVELKYKRFLALKRSFPELDMVPSSDIDQFWFEHYLDCDKYLIDCLGIFGHKLSQLEFYGLHRDSKTRNLKEALEETKHVYQKYFKEPYLGYRRLGENKKGI